jgi:hypothetical protein
LTASRSTAQWFFSGDFLSDRNVDDYVRFWRRRKVGKLGSEEGEKGHHLTRKPMNTSAGADEVGGGRKPRRSMAAGEENDDMDVDFVADWMCACVDEHQGRTAEMEVALA